MDLDLIPAHIAAVAAYLTGKLPRRDDERGQLTLETVIIIAAVLVVVGLVTAAIIAAVNKRLPSIK